MSSALLEFDHPRRLELLGCGSAGQVDGRVPRAVPTSSSEGWGDRDLYLVVSGTFGMVSRFNGFIEPA
jgi:hypothetical protein